MPLPGKKKAKTSGRGGFKIYEARGCKECMNTGYRGRAGVYELLTLNNAFRNKILGNPSLDELRKLAVAQGMQPLRAAAMDKVVAGLTSIEEVLRVT